MNKIEAAPEKKISKSTLNTAARYIARMRKGELMLRDSNGRVQWASGRNVGRVTFEYMMRFGLVHELDADLFGDPSRGQTLGLVPLGSVE